MQITYTKTFRVPTSIKSGLILVASILGAQALLAQTTLDDFEGGSTISTWFGDDCTINQNASNPFQQGINNSTGVLQYNDFGGWYANARFDVSQNFDMANMAVFKLKVYVPSSGLTGSQVNQISFKLQDGSMGAPWNTQCEIIKPIVLDQWQEVSFDFLNDTYSNFDPNSVPPAQRTDFNRALIQINGENNQDQVLGYIDDIVNDSSTVAGPGGNYVLVWSDEFDTDGPVDATKWHHQTQIPTANGWFNNEIQHYTDRVDNSYVSNGTLFIVGKAETFTDQGLTKQHTSARLNSKFAFKYGRVEARAKLPFGPGTWPAIWTLGKNIDEDGGYWDLEGFGTTGWPACGEIDIMEHWGTNQNYVSSATHTPSSFGGTVNNGGQNLSTASTAFHTYVLEWFPDRLEFSVDGNLYYTYNPAFYNGSTWPFDEDQYLLLNFALQASTPSSFTQDALELEYIRVYQDSILLSVPTLNNTASFELGNHPNPSTDQTTIAYTLPNATAVSLNIYTIDGRLVETLVNEKQAAGSHNVLLNTKGLAKGSYYYTLRTELGNQTAKCIVE